jgi:hypothetical protein
MEYLIPFFFTWEGGIAPIAVVIIRGAIGESPPLKFVFLLIYDITGPTIPIYKFYLIIIR